MRIRRKKNQQGSIYHWTYMGMPVELITMALSWAIIRRPGGNPIIVSRKGIARLR